MNRIIIIGLLLKLVFMTSIYESNAQSIDTLNYISLDDSIFISGSVYKFDSTSFLLGINKLGKQSYNELDSVAYYLKANPNLNVEIVVYGFCNPMMSLILTESRARVIYEYLINKGVSRNQISYLGYCGAWENRENPITILDIKCSRMQIEMIIK